MNNTSDQQLDPGLYRRERFALLITLLGIFGELVSAVTCYFFSIEVTSVLPLLSPANTLSTVHLSPATRPPPGSAWRCVCPASSPPPASPRTRPGQCSSVTRISHVSPVSCHVTNTRDPGSCCTAATRLPAWTRCSGCAAACPTSRGSSPSSPPDWRPPSDTGGNIVTRHM